MKIALMKMKIINDNYYNIFYFDILNYGQLGNSWINYGIFSTISQ